eukprot:766411-Hanusia_phi.AAC.5
MRPLQQQINCVKMIVKVKHYEARTAKGSFDSSRLVATSAPPPSPRSLSHLAILVPYQQPVSRLEDVGFRAGPSDTVFRRSGASESESLRKSALPGKSSSEVPPARPGPGPQAPPLGPAVTVTGTSQSPIVPRDSGSLTCPRRGPDLLIN